MTATELAEAYNAHARSYYRKPSGRRTSEQQVIACAMAEFVRDHGAKPAQDVTPADLAATRRRLLEKGLSRHTVNAYISRMVRAYQWACDPETALLEPELIAKMQAIRPLKFGRTQARETEPVHAAPEDDIDAVLRMLDGDTANGRERYQQDRLAAMIRLQAATGMRPGELCGMVAEGLKRGQGDGLWRYYPPEHKTEHHGHERTVYLESDAQAVLERWMARAEIRDTGRIFGTSVNSYRRALQRACMRAGVPPIKPHQLRHTAATAMARRLPLRTVGGMLGHHSIAMTERYATQTDHEIARAIGHSQPQQRNQA